MVRFRTEEELSDALDAELAWRRKELHLMKSDVVAAKGDRQTMLLRAATALLYAHWEGFVKASAQAYLDHVSAQKLAHRELATPFAAMALRRYASNAGTRISDAALRELLSAFREREAERAYIPANTEVNTQSNLSTAVFKDVVTCIGLRHQTFALSSNLFDEGLLKARNNVAHGSYLAVLPDRYLVWHDKVLRTMEAFAEELREAVRAKAYRRRQSA